MDLKSFIRLINEGGETRKVPRQISTTSHPSNEVLETLAITFICESIPCRRHILDIPGWVFVFRQNGAPAHQVRDTVAFLERKVLDFIPPTPWPPNSPYLNQTP